MSTPSNRASNPAGKSPKPKDVTLNLPTVQRMLPLVRRITADVVDAAARLHRLAPERDLLDDSRRALDWAGRQRRYAIADEIRGAEKDLSAAAGELTALGLKLVDPAAGAVDFPTRIHGRAAVYTWQFGEDRVGFWRYAGEDQRRPIPADWQPTASGRYRAEP